MVKLNVSGSMKAGDWVYRSVGVDKNSEMPYCIVHRFSGHLCVLHDLHGNVDRAHWSINYLTKVRITITPSRTQAMITEVGYCLYLLEEQSPEEALMWIDSVVASAIGSMSRGIR